jgi:hypothetical protein
LFADEAAEMRDVLNGRRCTGDWWSMGKRGHRLVRMPEKIYGGAATALETKGQRSVKAAMTLRRQSIGWTRTLRS